MTVNSATLILSFPIAACGIMIIVISPFFGFVLAKHFDPYFPYFVQDKNKIETGFWILNPMLRGIRYAGCMLMKNASRKWPYCRYYFNGFDFRAHAKTSDWVVIWIVLIAHIVILVTGGIIFVINGFHFPSGA